MAYNIYQDATWYSDSFILAGISEVVHDPADAVEAAASGLDDAYNAGENTCTSDNSATDLSHTPEAFPI